MKPVRNLLCAAVLGAVAAPASADLLFDRIGEFDIYGELLLQNDWNQFSEDVRRVEDQTGIRRAELALKGRSVNWEWSIQYDPRPNQWRDLFVQYRIGGGANRIRFGQFKQPWSIEELHTSRGLVQPARSLANAFTIGRRLGLEYSMGENEWRWSTAIYDREITNSTPSQQRGNGAVSRLSWAPVYDGVTTAGATEVVHLGAAIGFENVVDDRQGRPSWRVQSRPEADVTPTRLVDTGTFLDADKVNRWGVEGGWNSGPFNVMAEWQNYEVTRDLAADFKGTGGYVMASWFMTGEAMTYRDGLFTPPLPNDPEKGAVQFTARWSTIDLNDGLVRGGSEDNLTVGVNYWWRSNYMVSLNYGLIDSERGAITQDEPRVLTARVQLYW